MQEAVPRLLLRRPRGRGRESRSRTWAGTCPRPWGIAKGSIKITSQARARAPDSQPAVALVCPNNLRYAARGGGALLTSSRRLPFLRLTPSFPKRPRVRGAAPPVRAGGGCASPSRKGEGREAQGPRAWSSLCRKPRPGRSGGKRSGAISFPLAPGRGRGRAADPWSRPVGSRCPRESAGPPGCISSRLPGGKRQAAPFNSALPLRSGPGGALPALSLG